MAMRGRIISCDVEGCEAREEEKTYGSGWDGWAIIQGLSKSPPPLDRPMTQSDMQMEVCPRCKLLIAQFIEQELDNKVPNLVGTSERGGA